MTTAGDFLRYLQEHYPFSEAEEYDNCGLLIGDSGSEVRRCLLALDVTAQVIDNAVRLGAELIITHHPVIFHPLKKLSSEDPAFQCVQNGIAVISSHTCLDKAAGGVNDALADALGLRDTEILNVEGVNSAGEEYSYGRVGVLSEPTDMAGFLKRVKTALGANGLRYHNAGRPVYRVASVGGSGGSMLEYAAAKDCDTFVTSDIKYDVFLAAKEMGINLIDGDHFCTENTVVAPLADFIREAFPDVDVLISGRHRQTAQFM